MAHGWSSSPTSALARRSERRLEDAFERQADLEADKIRVIVDGDKVRLEGKVKAWFERDLAEHAAWAAPGVRAVEGRVTIGY